MHAYYEFVYEKKSNTWTFEFMRITGFHKNFSLYIGFYYRTIVVSSQHKLFNVLQRYCDQPVFVSKIETHRSKADVEQFLEKLQIHAGIANNIASKSDPLFTSDFLNELAI